MKKQNLMIGAFLLLALPPFAGAGESVKRTPSSGMQLCGQLKGECLNGGNCAHFITNDAGEHSIFGADSAVGQQLTEDVQKNVCAFGKYSRNGFVATSIKLSDM